MDIDKTALHHIFSMSASIKERHEVINLLKLSRSDATGRLVTLLLRDIMMFKDMSFSYISQYTNKIATLEKRIEALEERFGE